MPNATVSFLQIRRAIDTLLLLASASAAAAGSINIAIAGIAVYLISNVVDSNMQDIKERNANNR